MAFDHGPLRTYEITWKSGHVETVQGHQVLFGSDRLSLDAITRTGGGVADRLAPRFTIHGQFGGRWRLVLTAPEADLVSVRDVTGAEQLPEGAA